MDALITAEQTAFSSHRMPAGCSHYESPIKKSNFHIPCSAFLADGCENKPIQTAADRKIIESDVMVPKLKRMPATNDTGRLYCSYSCGSIALAEMGGCSEALHILCVAKKPKIQSLLRSYFNSTHCFYYNCVNDKCEVLSFYIAANKRVVSGRLNVFERPTSALIARKSHSILLSDPPCGRVGRPRTTVGMVAL